jgi:N-acetylmuramoyl-L-alanine amidase
LLPPTPLAARSRSFFAAFFSKKAVLSLIFYPSPNFDARPGDVDTLVLHYTGMQSGAAALARLCDPAAKVSSHYLVEEDGALYRLVEEQNRAWHAGVSYWRGVTGLNDSSIGIEIVNPGHEWGYRAFPELQIARVIRLCQEILARHPIPARNVVAHSDIAPDRKQDPGELFPWQRLAAAGIGLWPEDLASSGDLTGDLAAIGYDVTAPGAVLAFQRHYLPSNLTGEADAVTRGRAAALRRLVAGPVDGAG